MTCVNSVSFFVWKTKGVHTVIEKSSKRNLCINQKFRSDVSGRNSNIILSLTSHSKDAIDPILLEILDKSIRLIRISFLESINIIQYLITFTLPTLFFLLNSWVTFLISSFLKVSAKGCWSNGRFATSLYFYSMFLIFASKLRKKLVLLYPSYLVKNSISASSW